MADHPRPAPDRGDLLRRVAPRLAWPDPDERALVGRFYVAVAILYGTWLVAPFQFAYLFLVLDRPEWAVAPLVVASGVPLLAEVPTGVLADRWSRKGSVLLGGALGAVGVAAVPLLVPLEGVAQLVAVCGAFAVLGLGQTLMSGAQEAWVVDNLHAAGRPDLIEVAFARSHAVGALGGAFAAAAAVALLVTVQVGRGVLDLLWGVTAAGMVVAALFAATIPEHRASEPSPEGSPRGLAALLADRVRWKLALAIVVATFSGAAADQALVVSLLTKGLDARAFGALTLADNLLGVAGPLLGAWLARRIGASALLGGVLVTATAAASLVLLDHALPTMLGLYLALSLLDGVFDPVAEARLHARIPSADRATLGSAVAQASGLASVLGLGALGLVLGRYSEELQDLSADLFDAFTGQIDAPPPAPVGWLGVPVPDWALLVFVAVGTLALPLVLAGRGRPPPTHLKGSGRRPDRARTGPG